jgi:hypothetical protein
LGTINSTIQKDKALVLIRNVLLLVRRNVLSVGKRLTKQFLQSIITMDQIRDLGIGCADRHAIMMNME